jgi:hypothetical protein
MKAFRIFQAVKNAHPDADAYVRSGDKFFHVDEVILSAVDPTITGPTTVLFEGTEYVPKDTARQNDDDTITVSRSEWDLMVLKSVLKSTENA